MLGETENAQHHYVPFVRLHLLRQFSDFRIMCNIFLKIKSGNVRNMFFIFIEAFYIQ